MKVLKINKKLTILLILLFAVAAATTVSGRELTLKEAIGLGLDNNREIKAERHKVNQLKRDLMFIQAQEDWQINLGADYSYSFNDGDFSDQADPLRDSNSGASSLDMSLSKTLPSGFNLNPEISITEEGLNPDLSLVITQPILPSLPTEMAQRYYRTGKELLKAEENLERLKTTKLLSWLKSYLELKRIKEREDIYIKGVEKAEDNLTKVQERQKIGDAGKTELLTARLSLENASYELRKIENQLEEARFTLVREFGLESGENILITDSPQLLAQLREKAVKITEKYLATADLISIVEKNSYDIQANLIDREILKQELNWLQKEAGPDLELSGRYNTSSDELRLGLNLTYQLYDGGQLNLELEEKEIAVENNRADFTDIYNQLKQQLNQYINTVELSQMALVRGELKLEKSNYELEAAKKQLEVGLIDYLEYQDYWTTAVEAQIEFASLEDQLFLNRLELISFVNIDEVRGGF